MSSCFLDNNKKSSCCGCKACASVCNHNAITFYFDEEGFWYPQIDEGKCVFCNKCRNVCPLNDDVIPVIKDENQTYAAFSKSDTVLKRSASGGMFSVISDYILTGGGVLFGHVYDEDCNCYCISGESQEDRNKMCGSKYVQSDMRDIFRTIKDYVNTGRKVLFTGTPCQIDAVKKYLGKGEYENFLTMGLVCHGVPSPKIFKEYIIEEEKKAGKKIKEVIFRSKEKGWTKPLRKFVYKDGNVAAELLNADAFNNLFQGTDCILRPSCYECRYAGKKRIEDITVADFWGIQNKHPDMFNDNKGVSLVLVNTKRGLDLFEKIKQNLVYKQVPLVDAQDKNIPLVRPVKPFKIRDKVFMEYKKYGSGYILKKYLIRKKLFDSFPARVYRKILNLSRRMFAK